MAEEIISSVKVEGNKYLTNREVLKLLNLHKGVVFSPDYIYRSIKNAYSTGSFEYIGIYKEENPKEGLSLLVKVKDLPIVYDVEFVGNREISEEELRRILGIPKNPQELLEQQTGYISGPAVEEKLQLKKLVPIGHPLTAQEIENMVRRIKLRYAMAGYPNVKVHYKIIPVKGASKLVFYIDEGKPQYVEEITIKGLKHLDSGEIKDVMELEEPNIFLLRFHPPYSPLVLKHDIENINRFLKSRGFLEGKVEKYEVKTSPEGGVKITLYIHEGKRYKVGKVILEGNTYFGYKELTDEFFEKLKKENGYFDQKLVELLKREILQKYKNLGLYFTRVYIDIKPDREKKVVDILVRIEESPPTYDRWTEIKGNYETRDYVIRRELEVHEGDLITEERIKWSKIWVERLGYYAGVEIKPVLLSPEYAKTVVKVKERFTGQFSVGIGYSETSGISGFVSLRKGNFLGTGDIVSLNLSWGEFAKNYSFSYTRKWFLHKPQDLNFSAYSSSHDYDTYNVSYKGISTTLTRRFWHYWNWHVGLDLQSINYSDISPDASIYVKESAQFNSATILRFGINRDTRDNYIFPSEGSYFALNEKFGGILGGDEKFIKTTLRGSYYQKDPIWDTGTILSVRGQIGTISPWGGAGITPIDERFFVGGDYTIRGYKYGYAGPVDPNTGDPIGANRMWAVSFEADYPVKEKSFYIGTFLDVGNGANSWKDLFSDVKAGVGFGLRFITPMAPIKLDFAWKLKKVEGDTNKFRIHLIIGSFF